MEYVTPDLVESMFRNVLERYTLPYGPPTPLLLWKVNAADQPYVPRVEGDKLRDVIDRLKMATMITERVLNARL